ncbi:helix-turn-helix domain-containing protein [Flavobacterium sp.]|uniref:helix-turn-helix domain-containing protein n=1 Tax=Flavobacterium sp. TaxID=239 RepID=UPI00286E2674|nr:helix-turn-helix domain-containing protein [Flavobacterium sp.]
MPTKLYVLFFFIANIAFSQSNYSLTDQEYQKLHDKSRLLINSNVDSSFIYANRIEKSNNHLHKSFAYGIKSYLYQLKGDSIKSKQFYKQALVYLDKMPQSNNKTKLNAYLLNYGGLAERKRGNLSNALLQYEKGKKLSLKLNDIIQVIKFSYNISNIYGDTGNYKLAIEKAKEADEFLNKYQSKLDFDQFYNNKSNLNINLGNFYENFYYVDLSKKSRLDSAIFYYKKSIVYSKDFIRNKIIAQINLANIYLNERDYVNSEKLFQEIILFTKENNFEFEYYSTNYNYGCLLYTQKKYNKALICFSKVDSIYKTKNAYPKEFYLSNYYQAKIYNESNNPEKALYHSESYIENYEKIESKLLDQSKSVNLSLINVKYNEEMKIIQNKYHKSELYGKILKIGLSLIFIIVLVLLIKNNIAKKKAQLRIKELIEEFRNNKEKITVIPDGNIEPKTDVISKNKNNTLNIDELKEKEIISKLNDLEHKEAYLMENFTQQYVAKKIKTNTTYLSYVVNKNFGKSFSEYANELKINYVINQMIVNSNYRKYSTQAIAESVGFKNATSFTKSFKKRTGVTPVLFAQNI